MKHNKTTLIKSISGFSAMTLLSRVLGFVRDMLIAMFFGANASLDAFLLAFRIPNLMRRMVAEGAFTQVFVPILVQQRQQQSASNVASFIGVVFGALMTITLLLTLIGVLFAPEIVKIFAPGFYYSEDLTRYNLAVLFVRLLFPYLFFVTVAAFCMALLNAHNYYLAGAFAPVFLNVFMIIGAVYFSRLFAIEVLGLIWGVLLSGVLQVIFLLICVKQAGLRLRVQFKFFDNRLKMILTSMLPALVGVSVVQLNLLMGSMFASFLVQGSVSWLYYSDRVVQLPLGVFGIALATVVLPNLSSFFSDKNYLGYTKVFRWAMNTAWLITLPATLGLIILAKPIIFALFYRGDFLLLDVQMTSESLIGFAIGLPGFIWLKIQHSTFFAQQDYRTPLIAGIYALVVNFIFAILLLQPLAHMGLALATSLSCYVNIFILQYKLRQSEYYLQHTVSNNQYWQTLVAAMVVAIIAWFFPQQIIEFNGIYRLLATVLYIIGIVITYVLVLWLLRVRITDIASFSS